MLERKSTIRLGMVGVDLGSLGGMVLDETLKRLGIVLLDYRGLVRSLAPTTAVFPTVPRPVTAR